MKVGIRQRFATESRIEAVDGWDDRSFKVELGKSEDLLYIFDAVEYEQIYCTARGVFRSPIV
jgi:c-di-AMP phosphodiesterase-like protein